MASPSFRDRFFTPPVARAVTSPSGILAAGGGAAVGILVTIGTGGLIVPIAAVLGGLLGYGTRVALAIPRGASASSVDPFGVNEPWRHAVQDAIQARRRFDEAIKTVRSGPLRDTLDTIDGRLDEAVEQCWLVAKQGQLVADARRRIDDREIAWQLQQLASQIPPGGEASPTQAKTVASLNAQLASAARMDDLIRSTNDELALLNARLDETVTQAIELSVTNQSVQLEPVSDSVGDIVDSLTALRQAMTTVDAAAGSQVLRIDDRAANDVADPATEPPTEPGQVQSSDGS